MDLRQQRGAGGPAPGPDGSDADATPGTPDPVAADGDAKASPPWLRGPVRFAITTAAAALITTAVSVAITGYVHGRDARRDLQREAARPPLVLTVSYDWSDAEMWATARPLPARAAARFEGLTAADTWSSTSIDRMEALLRRNDAVRIESHFDAAGPRRQHTSLRLVAAGDRARPVLIQDMRLRVLTRRAPLSGTLVYGPPQGEASAVTVGFDLDERRPIARRVDRFGALGKPYFSGRFVTLARGEPIEFYAQAFTDTCYCEWELDLDVVADGVVHTVVARDGDRAFRTTAFADDYELAYAGPVEGPHVFTRQPPHWSPRQQ